MKRAALQTIAALLAIIFAQIVLLNYKHQESLSTSCVALRGSVSQQFAWIEAPGRPALSFQVSWSSHFQVYELLWANSSSQSVQFRFAVDSALPVTGQFQSKRLRSRSRESPPGVTVIPSRRNKQVCVSLMLDTRAVKR